MLTDHRERCPLWYFSFCLPETVGLFHIPVVCSVVGLSNLSTLGPTQSAYEPRVSRWFLASLSLSLLIQLSGALLIALRAWATPTLVFSDQPSRGAKRRSRIDPIALLCVWIESGAMYVLTTLLLLIYFARQTALEPVILTAITGQISVGRLDQKLHLPSHANFSHRSPFGVHANVDFV